MSIQKRILLGFLILYVLVTIGTVFYSQNRVKKEVYDQMTLQYQEHFRTADSELNHFFTQIGYDLMTFVENPMVNTREDDVFTSFLEADEKTFRYQYSENEQVIIKLFNDYRVNHPFVNSVYMGRENGSFVRSHPRSAPTQYDPRQRPWYQLAVANPGIISFTDAYSSVTNTDVNIGTVLSLNDESGKPFGVIGIDVTLAGLSQKIGSIKLAFDGHMELWDYRDIVLVSPDVTRQNQTAQGIDGVYIGSFNTIRINQSKDYLMMTYPVSLPEGRLIAYVPKQVVDKEIKNILMARVTFVTVSILFILVWSLVLLEFFVFRPLDRMSHSLMISNQIGVPRLMDVEAVGELKKFKERYNQLIKMIEKEEDEHQKIKLLTISSLASLAEKRDYETGSHITRTQKYVELLAKTYNQMNPDKKIEDNRLDLMCLCAPLHDIGKVAIPDNILLKPGRLTPEEFELMKLHTIYGKEAMENGYVEIEDKLFIEVALAIVTYHHERWDGQGYPKGLKGELIPLEARIMSVADVYDALTTKRVYKDSIGHQDAMKIIIEGSGTQFDPMIVEALIKVDKAFEAIAIEYGET